ncbi:MAG: prephenate dehydrogenase/arogenate dehydrogenase family protein [Deltaproteobacteria bacterium]|nr:prephenate dehydrogenase/arogenate dehydrogenase family protein [Deltaproteobacteria bacterium]
MSTSEENGVDPRLDRLRQRLDALDEQLLTLAQERLTLARQVGEIKRSQGLPTIDYSRERQVLDRAANLAEEIGLEGGLGEDLMARLIRAAVTAQEGDSLHFAATGAGERAVVLGGAGRMGQWMSRFLEAQGFAVAVLDPAASEEENQRAHESLPTASLVLCSTPPGRTASWYHQWCEAPLQGVVADLASIKTPLLGPIRELQRAGGRVASFHPMFGPATLLLRDADVLVCDTGDSEATAAVEALFEPTTAHLVRLPLADHDRIMADLLSLAHATAIAFALALPESEHPVRSTSFSALEGLAAAVVRESPDVYFEIQANNPHSLAAVERLRAAVEQLISVVRARSPADFEALLEQGARRTNGPARVSP